MGAQGAGEPPVVDAFGVRWVLDVAGLGPALADRLLGLWERAALPGVTRASVDPDEAPPYVVTWGEDGLVSIHGDDHRLEEDAVPYAVSRGLTVASIGRRVGTCLLLHAAGIAAPDGATLALVAASGTGKTTAARVLGRTLGYVTDETVAVESDLTVRGYPKPLSVVVDPDAPFDKAESSPDELGLLAAPSPLHLAGVVLLDRVRPDDPPSDAPDLPDGPVLEPVGLVEAAVAMIPQTSALLRMPDPLGSLARALTRGGGPWRLRYTEVEECADLLADLLRQGDAAGGGCAWTTEVGPEAVVGPEDGVSLPPAVEVRALAPDTVVARAPWRHALHAEGSSLVVVGSVPLGLPGVAATLWRAVTEPQPVSAVVDAAVATLGAHPDAADVVDDTVRSLLRTGAFVLIDPDILDG
ncbi:adenylate kinase family protein [Phycicoccus flavus]|uniref:hypothetical protein n=1 Tax=Phycicoccus flavus TaxID=2502783 RepID=UPI000FEBD039|nr:hypothetical protein [Phycicoccus flavus]NHA68833.1 hypothetical protein [Phycicoccus flavus]